MQGPPPQLCYLPYLNGALSLAKVVIDQSKVPACDVIQLDDSLDNVLPQALVPLPQLLV